MKSAKPIWKDRTARRIAIVCLAVNLFVLLLVAVKHPVYLRDYTLNSNPDAVHFVLLGRNIYEKGVYSRCDSEPYVPDIMRPPGYPIFTGILYGLFGTMGVYVFNTLCHVTMAVGVYWLTRPVFGERASTFAGYLVAVDLMLAVSNFTAMSEPLFCVAATIGVLLWLRRVVDPSPTRLLGLIGIGAVLGFATLTRPTSLYIPVVITVAAILVSLLTRQSRVLLQTLVVAVVSILAVVPWVIRNQVVFGVPKITHTEVSNLVYWSGATAHAIHLGIPVEEAQEAVREEFGLVSLRDTNNHWRADRSVREMYLEQKRAVKPVLMRYPVALLKSSALGIFKASIAHNTGELGEMCDVEWQGPGLGGVLSGDVAALAGMMRDNPLSFVFVFVWELLLAVVVLVLGLVGLVRGLWSPRSRIPVLCLCAVVAYYWLTIAVIGAEAYYRHRSMVVPLWCVFAALAVFPTGGGDSAEDDRQQAKQ